MAVDKHDQIRHTSIIKGSDDVDASYDSDDVFDDEETTPQVLKTDSEESKKTITSTQSQPTSVHSLNNSDDKFVNSDGQCRSLHNQRDNRRPGLYFCSPSPNFQNHTNDQRLPVFDMRPTHSLVSLFHPHPNSLKQELTDDSGRGDSLENIPARTPVDKSGNFTMVEVHGQPGVTILMKNRFDFDATKLEEHRKKKRSLRILSPKQGPPTIGKSSGFFGRLSRSSKASTNESYADQPVHRHHSSINECKDNV
ncbi:unnamed protein product [Adineta ricciae]|uniref:Uncharacterized protein n=1 Tax=Adineta ricciae TaxID=249248 RepID=A0A816A1Q5_ADIRI|nr:unnamed protein product [Adineta ricciae]CAF1589348.1 unnamed protein product [Adineta ricciae]